MIRYTGCFEEVGTTSGNGLRCKKSHIKIMICLTSICLCFKTENTKLGTKFTSGQLKDLTMRPYSKNMWNKAYKFGLIDIQYISLQELR